MLVFVLVALYNTERTRLKEIITRLNLRIRRAVKISCKVTGLGSEEVPQKNNKQEWEIPILLKIKFAGPQGC